MSDPARPKLGKGEAWKWYASAIVLLAGLLWLAYRVYYNMSFPTIAGSDPYTRLFHRQELVVELFGGKWLPLLQLVPNTIFAIGGDIRHVKLFGSS